MTTPALDQPTRVLARTFATRLRDVRQDFVDRDEAVDLLALAVLCREHVLLVGPPGTAKSSLLERFRRTLDACCFSYLLTRFTEPAELFGPIDIRRLQTEGVYQVNTAGMLPEADIALLDEVFQGSSAILNTLLTLINERTFHNGTRMVDTSLITLLGASNDIPDDPVLAAFSDRFLLRCRLDYVPDDDIEDVLTLGWRGEQELINPAAAGAGGPAGRTRVGFGLADLGRLQRAVADIDLTAVRGPFARIVRSLRAEGVVFSDRRAVKAQKTFAARALLAGRAAAELADLAPLVHLWTNPRDEQTIRRIVADAGVPVDRPGRTVRSFGELRIDLAELAGQRARVAGAEEFRELLRRGQRLVLELRRDHPDARDLLADVQRHQRETIAIYRERFAEEELVDV
ncbi:AAA family ATPase [Protofrankia coriariae]|uniref:ATPase n=1 Tax=Protofrankia coriariae TaxID=1562887 RepID=A0ABR5F397_9ACTN|nr:AAA family ATPase [Protofrankia coriariae]KLL11164.1 ATPase [Protofrankia coriariae]